MPALTNPRHERFARLFMKTGNAAASYLKAGYSPSTRESLDPAASKLTRSNKVKTRIRELQRQMATRNRITVDGLLEELATDRDHARRLDQPSVAVQATMSQARLVGLLVDRKEHGQPGEFAGLDSEAQVLERVRRELGEDTAQVLQAALARAEQGPEVAALQAQHADDDPPPLPTHTTPDTVN